MLLTLFPCGLALRGGGEAVSFRHLFHKGYSIVKVNASALRQGNVVEYNDKLYVVLKADNIQPGKGTPVTQLEMRRISDGVKTSERFRTTEQVEKAFIEEGDYQYLYEDADGSAFMEVNTFDQIIIPKQVIGDGQVYLQEGLVVKVYQHEGVPVSIELPQRVTLEVTETEPVVKGQTAASSNKPATLSNGLRVMVPSHITAGTRVIVNTADNTYQERAKD